MRFINNAEAAICGGGSVALAATVARLNRAHRFAGALDGGFRQFGGVRITSRFVGDRAQAEALHGVETSVADPAVVVSHAFRLAIFQIKLAVIGIPQCVVDDRFRARSVEPRAIEK